MTKKRLETKRANSETKEKIFLVVFLIFAIALIIILFKAPTGNTILGAKLDSTSYNPCDDINGMISLQFQEGDFLPEDTSIKLLIRTNTSKCPLNYVCSNDKIVPWYEIDETGECILKTPDPEGACCIAYSSNCYQKIVNSGFDDEIKFWNPSVYRVGGEPFGIDYLDMYDVYEDIEDIYEEFDFSPEAAFTDTSGTLRENSYVALRHNLGSKRKIKIAELKCIENWQCTNWGPCICWKNIRYRTCTDLNSCGTIDAKPPESEDCSCYVPEVHEQYQIMGATPPALLSKSLKYMFYWETDESLSCAFEVIVKGESEARTERNLHFYYTLDDCPMPSSDTAIDKYVNMGTPGMYDLHIVELDLYGEWTGKGWSENDTIEEIWLVGYGDEKDDEVIGQFVLWDNIELIKYGAPEVSANCEERHTRKNPKVCCREETGIGSYYGDQLNCSAGYECWSECTDSIEFSLKDFERKRNTEGRGKYNKTGEGFATAVVDGAEIDLEYTWLDKGDGYSACFDTSSNARGSGFDCRSWDNIYTSEIQDLTSRTELFEAPDQAGTYEFIFKIEYLPEGWPPECLPEEEEWGYCGPILIDEKSILFSVSGEVPDGAVLDPCKWANTSNWSSWSDCDSLGFRTRTRNCTLAYDTPRPCDESNKAECTTDKWADPACEVLEPCTKDDYDLYDWCDDWTPSPCGPDENQTRNCDANLEVCNATHPDAYQPLEERECSITAITEYTEEQATAGIKRKDVENELSLYGWSSSNIKTVLDSVYGKEEGAKWWIWVLLAVIIAAAAVLLILKMKKPKVKKAAIPQELLSYIKDAVAAGSTKAEIASRLVQAGWPRESVDAAIKTLK